MSNLCGSVKPIDLPFECEDLPEQNFSWKDFIGVNLQATFNFKPIKKELGILTIGMLGNADKILTDGNAIRIVYKDGTKYTINKSWFN